MLARGPQRSIRLQTTSTPPCGHPAALHRAPPLQKAQRIREQVQADLTGPTLVMQERGGTCAAAWKAAPAEVATERQAESPEESAIMTPPRPGGLVDLFAWSGLAPAQVRQIVTAAPEAAPATAPRPTPDRPTGLVTAHFQ